MALSDSLSMSISETKPNRVLQLAAAIAAFSALLHIFMGGAEIAAPLLAAPLDSEVKLVSYAVWHMASVALSLSAIALFIGSLPKYAQDARLLVLFVSALWSGFGLCFLAVAATQDGENLFLTLAQWTLLLPVGLLGFWASYRRSQPGATRDLVSECG